MTDKEFLMSVYDDVQLSTCWSWRYKNNVGYIVIRFDGKVCYDWVAGTCETPDEAWAEARERVGQRMLNKLEGNDSIV